MSSARGLPGDVRTPWGAIALADALDAASRYHHPVRAAVVVEWEVPH